jgi:glycosyltransferase involved in cell wall biosynthesis
MKVLFISRRFYPDVIGGGQISALYIAKAVKEQGNEVFVCTFTDDKKERKEDLEGITVYRIPIPKLRLFPRLSNMDYMYIQMARLSSEVIKKVNPDIIHLLNFESVPLSSIHYKQRFKKIIVATVNAPNFGCFMSSGVDAKGNACLKCTAGKRLEGTIKKYGRASGFFYFIYSFWYMGMLRYSYRYVDRFFTVSDAMKPLLEGMGVPPGKMKTVYNPIDVHDKVKTSLKKRLGIDGKRVILYIGRLAEEKGVQYTIQAMPSIENAVFVIAGEKRGYFKELSYLVERLKLQDKVKFCGYVENKMISEYYSIADAAVLTENYYEPLSRFLLEAGSYGIPILANDIGGNREIIENGKNGYLLDNMEPSYLAGMLKKTFSKKEKLGKYAREKIGREFSSSRIGNILNKEYLGLLIKNEKYGR